MERFAVRSASFVLRKNLSRELLLNSSRSMEAEYGSYKTFF